jgi:hypothetical protein
MHTPAFKAGRILGGSERSEHLVFPLITIAARMMPNDVLRTRALRRGVHTGTPDFVEITNVSLLPAPVAGIGIVCSNNAVCPSAGPGNGGAYVSASPVIVPPGGTYVFEDVGVAGAIVLTVPILPPGEHTGFNFS